MKDKDKKALAVGLGITGAVVAVLIYTLRARGEEPDKAILYGQVTDEVTTEPISGIDVNCGEYTGNTDSAGNYRIINIEPGTYPISFTDPHDRYETLTV